MDNNEQRLDVIWAPWRYDYIQSSDKNVPPSDIEPGSFLPQADPACFLCQAAACPSDQEIERYIIHRRPHSITLLNRFPYNNGHLLVAPKRHISSISDLTPEEWHDITCELSHWVDIIRKTMNAEGFNIGLNLGRIAGAGLPGHIHWHIVPRWNGDTNFITTISSTKAIPQSLASVAALLREHLPPEK